MADDGVALRADQQAEVVAGDVDLAGALVDGEVYSSPSSPKASSSPERNCSTRAVCSSDGHVGPSRGSVAGRGSSVGCRRRRRRARRPGLGVRSRRAGRPAGLGPRRRRSGGGVGRRPTAPRRSRRPPPRCRTSSPPLPRALFGAAHGAPPWDGARGRTRARTRASPRTRPNSPPSAPRGPRTRPRHGRCRGDRARRPSPRQWYFRLSLPTPRLRYLFFFLRARGCLTGGAVASSRWRGPWPGGVTFGAGVEVATVAALCSAQLSWWRRPAASSRRPVAVEDFDPSVGGLVLVRRSRSGLGRARARVLHPGQRGRPGISCRGSSARTGRSPLADRPWPPRARRCCGR